jgi:hypothetical protein
MALHGAALAQAGIAGTLTSADFGVKPRLILRAGVFAMGEATIDSGAIGSAVAGRVVPSSSTAKTTKTTR